MDLRSYKTARDRRLALEKETGVSLSHTGAFTFEEAAIVGRNCENLVGAAQVPLGVAGPLQLEDGRSKMKVIYIPLATTEGALVASVNRGCKAVAESGGARVDAQRIGATRGPVFRVRSQAANRALHLFLEDHLEELRRIAGQTSQHIRLEKISSQQVGHYRYVRFVFDTQDAMGMNMVTKATDAITKHIESRTGAVSIALSGNYCVDKKPAWLNIVENRGIKAWAEAVLPQRVLHKILRTDARRMHEVWLTKCMIGSAMSGSMGYNAHFANVIAALFAASGQDLGHIGECSVGITVMEMTGLTGQDLYVSVYLPDLMLGTVGGGTGLATQAEALSLLGVAGGAGGQHAETLAKITAGTVLAGEISLLASLAEGSLSKAHEKLGRGRT